MIRTRFAPSPTGYLHVGGLRTALYSYLVAKKAGGKFLLRIEDTDQARSVEGAVKNLLAALRWAGIEPDEQPIVQSERLEIYRQHAQKLLSEGNAYYCFCPPERLAQLRQRQEKNKQPTGYDQLCLKTVNFDEAQKRALAGEKNIVRLKMPKEGETVFNDLIRGQVAFKNELVDDQVLLKSDGFPTYHLAVVVDDHLMKITDIIRGEEWISSTPKHLQLYKYFGWEPPRFAHLPLILNPDKSKLSKRQGDVSVEDYKNKGYLSEALVNFIAFLGWNPGGERELFTLDELVEEFSLEKVSKAGAVFNIEKLNWFNQQYLKRLPLPELTERARPWFSAAILDDKRRDDKQWLEKVLALERERVTTLAELPEAVKFIFELPDYPAELLVWKKSTRDEARKVLLELKEFLEKLDLNSVVPSPPQRRGQGEVSSLWTKGKLEQKVGEWIKEKGYSTGAVLWPLRVALSGQQNSPGPFEIAEVLGKEETRRRLEMAIQRL